METARLMGTHLKMPEGASDGTIRARETGDDRLSARQSPAETIPHSPQRARSYCTKLLVTAALGLVYAWSPLPQFRAEEKTSVATAVALKERAFHGPLPPNVVEMREQILAAVHSGDIGELVDAIEWNEIKPDFGAAGQDDPIAFWKRQSADGTGREILAAIANMLALPPARLALGRDPENTMVYVWPYLAELPLDGLKPGEEVDLLRLMPAEKASAMRAAKKWTWWRLAIGADGTWHTFRAYD